MIGFWLAYGYFLYIGGPSNSGRLPGPTVTGCSSSQSVLTWGGCFKVRQDCLMMGRIIWLFHSRAQLVVFMDLATYWAIPRATIYALYSNTWNSTLVSC